MSEKKYPRALKTKFELRSTCGMDGEIRVVNNCYGGVLFDRLFGISFHDWDLLVKWVDENRLDKKWAEQNKPAKARKGEM